MNRIAQQDEILQMMYWMRGEHVADRVTAEELNRFLHIDEADLQSALLQLVTLGMLERTGQSYALTDRGITEGARRFADEFSSVLGREDHLSCSDPHCQCRQPGWDGVCHSTQVNR